MARTHFIDINLPRTWNALTTEQVEGISRIFIESAKKYTSTGKLDTNDILAKAFFFLSGIRVISLPKINGEIFVGDIETTDISADLIYYECEFVDDNIRQRRQSVSGAIIPIRIYLNELLSFTTGIYKREDIDAYLKSYERYYKLISQGRNPEEPKVPELHGPLAWLLSPSTLTLFPYPELELKDSKDGDKIVKLQGPAEMMQDFTWRQYRFATDFISYLSKCENQLYDLQHQVDKIKPTDIQKLNRLKNAIVQQDEIVKEARSQFLATLFSRPVKHIDKETGLVVNTPMFVSTQCTDNAYLFTDFQEVKFQSISFWWQGMMNHLQHQFPKVFRREAVGKSDGHDDDPFKLYTRSTTTMIKYAAANEDEVNNSTYTIILQHLNDMAEENDRIEEIKKKR